MQVEFSRASTRRPGGYREVWQVAYPLMISTGSLSLMQFCDRMFLSRHSAVSIQAALPASILAFTAICGFMAMANYANTFVAQYYGAGDREGCSRSTAQGFFLALFSWPLVLALIPVGRAALHLFGHPPAVLEEELVYYTILLWGSLPTLLSAALSSFFSGRGDTRTTMWVYVFANLLNIGLDFLMIFGHGGFPAMGIRGAAYATVISGAVSPLLFAWMYFSPRMRREYATRRTFRFEGALFRRLIRFGAPSGVHLALDLTSFTLFVLLTGRMGELALATSNIVLSINTLAFMPVIGMGIASSILVGQYMGRREPQHAERAGWTSLKMGLGYMLAMGLTYVLFPSFYVSLFTGGGPDSLTLPEVLPMARPLMILLAVWGTADACDLILAGALKGAGDTRFVMYYSLALAWGMLVAGQLILVLALRQGIYVSWLWTCLYIVVMAVGYLVRFRRGRWKSIRLLERNESLLPPGGRPGADALLAGE